MENQATKVTGYRELCQEEIDLINKVKAQGVALHALIIEVKDHLSRQAIASGADGTGHEMNRLLAADAYRWAEKAKFDLQVGLMSLTRAVAQPTSF